MPAKPTLSDLHVSAALTDLSVAFAQADENFVHDRAFPIVGVAKQSDKFFVYSREDWMRSDAQPRSPGDESAGGAWASTTDVYFAERFALHIDIDDPTRANADIAIGIDQDAVSYLTQQLRIRNEKDWVSSFFTTAVWDGASSSTDLTGLKAPTSTSTNFLRWNDSASNPIEDIRGEITAIAKNTGRRPNTLVLGAEVWTALADHPDFMDRIKYSQRGVMTEDLVASILGLERVMVSWAAENTAIEGAASGTFSFVAGKNALLSYVPASAGLRTPAAGYTFSWTGMPGSVAQGARIKRFRLERNESDRIEAEHWRDFKVVSSALGAFFASAVSTS